MATMMLTGNTITGGVGIANTTGPGTVISFGNNVIKGGGVPTQTIALQ
jgi:hypothetical protein